MAFVRRAVKLMPSLIGVYCQKNLVTKSKNIFFHKSLRTVDFYRCSTRALSTEREKKFEYEGHRDIEEMIFLLQDRVRKKIVFLDQARLLLEALKKKGEITDQQIKLLLRCCFEVSFMAAPSERLQFAEDIWKTASDLGASLDVSHYNVLLTVFIENDHKFSPSEFLKSLKEKGIEPNVITFRRILKAYCKQGDLKKATKFLEDLKEMDFPLSEEDFSSLILCYSENGDFENAENIMKLMQEKDLDYGSMAYTNLFRGYIKHGKIDKMFKVMEELAEKDVFLFDSDLFEIIYALIVYNQSEHVEKILQKLNSSFSTSKQAEKIIYKLLHQNMDSEAWKFFEKFEKTYRNSNTATNNEAHHIIKFYGEYRSPSEILDACDELEQRGWIKTALSLTLRHIFFHRDENFCLEFINALKDRDIPVRSHYYWPMLIKASKKGNEKMLSMLKSVPLVFRQKCMYTTTKVVFPNFSFSKNWTEDYEVLKSSGLSRRYLGGAFFGKFLDENVFDTAEDVASSLPVPLYRYNSILNSLFTYLQVHPDESTIRHCVNIMYYLAHDFTFLPVDKRSDKDMSSDVQSFYDVSLKSFMRNFTDEEVFRKFLEIMLEKKLGITEKTAAIVQNATTNQDVIDLLNKLMDPELEPKYDKNLLELKGIDMDGSVLGTDSAPEYVLESDLSPFEKTLKNILDLVKADKNKEGVELAESLVYQGDPSNFKVKQVFRKFLMELCVRNSMLTEKMFNQGVDWGLLKPTEYILIVRTLFKSGNVSEAVEKYTEFMRKHKIISGCAEFLKTVVAQGTPEDLRKFMTVMSEHTSRNLSLTHLFIALMENNKKKEAKNLLETKSFRMLDQQVYRNYKRNEDKFTSDNLLSYLKFLRHFDNVDRIIFYKLLIKEFAKENRVDRLKELWLLLEDDDVSDYNFLNNVRDLMENPSLDRLHKLAESAFTDVRVKSEKSDEEKVLMERIS